jgi:uncharacterized delta-60 repeat protein
MISAWSSDGTLDSTFGSGGKVITVMGKYSDAANAMALQGDGKILVVGSTETVTGFTSTHDIAVVRYNSNGSLDSTFGSGGKVSTSFARNSDEYGNDIAVQPDGKIVVVGEVVNANADVAVVRYNSNGSLDSTFGSGGKVSIDMASGSGDNGVSVVLQSDGKIVVLTNNNSTATGAEVGLVRLNGNGSLDTSFGTGGKTLRTLGPDSTAAWDMALQGDGKIVIVGQSDNPGVSGDDIAVARFNTDGSADSTFGTAGLAVINPRTPPDSETGHTLAIQSDGKILAAGHTDPNGDPNSGDNFILVRLNPDGSLDPTYNGTGYVITPVGPQDDYGMALALQSDGKAVLGGKTNISSTQFHYNFALARYLGDAPMSPTVLQQASVSGPSPAGTAAPALRSVAAGELAARAESPASGDAVWQEDNAAVWNQLLASTAGDAGGYPTAAAPGKHHRWDWLSVLLLELGAVLH